MSDVFDILSEKLGNEIGKVAEKNKDEVEVIIYGIKRRFKYLSWFFAVFLFSFFLNTVVNSFVSLFTFMLMRHRMQGSHMSNSYLCLAYSTAIPIGISLISMYLTPQIWLMTVVFVMSLVIIEKSEFKSTDDEYTNACSKERLVQNKIEVLTIVFSLSVTSLLVYKSWVTVSTSIFISMVYCIVDFVFCNKGK